MCREGRKPPQGAALISMRDYDWSKSVRTPRDVRHSSALIGRKAYVHPVTYAIARRVSMFENPAKGRPQTSSLRYAVIRQKVNKMAARKRTLTVEDGVRIVSTKQSNSVDSESQSNPFSTVLNKTLDELIDLRPQLMSKKSCAKLGHPSNIFALSAQ